jgi:putative CocE/NonD family hydrolase
MRYAELYNHLPLRELPGLEKVAPFFYEWLDHPHYDRYWADRDASGGLKRTEVAAFSLGGWYDVFLEGSIKSHATFRAGHAGEHARLMLTPWWHGPHGRYIGELDFGSGAGAEWLDVRVMQFLARHLRDEDVADIAEVEAFVTGVNRWQQFETWPPAAKAATYYIRAERGANSLNGDGRLTLESPGDERPDRFTYDPAMPTPSLGGRSGGSSPITPVGPADQRPIELSHAVLVYTSDALPDDLFVSGRLNCVLYAMTSAKDTDWTVKICDVYPDEKSINVQETIWRASYGSTTNTGFRPANEVSEFLIPVGSLCHVFRKGHRLRMEISSSNFPHWDRNLNTGNPLGVDTLSDRVVATQTVLHDAQYPSRLILPVISDSDA